MMHLASARQGTVCSTEEFNHPMKAAESKNHILVYVLHDCCHELAVILIS